jgi:SAM-dependent methyltransferase
LFPASELKNHRSVGSLSKFEGDVAERWSDASYANAARYLSHRAEILCSLGPPLVPGDRVLDLACGDGALGRSLLPRGLAYIGVDGSESMVAAARKGLAGAAEIVRADINDYQPESPVAATTLFGALYYVRDRPAFFSRVASFTEKKFVFNMSPRRFRLDEIRSELLAAGFSRLVTRPFLVPQSVRLPDSLLRLLIAAERTGPFARSLLRFRFSYMCAALTNGA